MALNVWQPEVVRGRHKQIVEQNVVPVESRVHALEMELKLCKQQISGFEKAYVSCGNNGLLFYKDTVKNSVMVYVGVLRQKDEKRRLDVAKEELKSMRYHPLRQKESTSSVKDECETNVIAKKLKRCSKGKPASTLYLYFFIF